MSIHFFSEDVDLPMLDYERIKSVLKWSVRKNRSRLGEINYIFCNDEYLLSINVEFLGHDYYTDVITFDYSEPPTISGDIYISLDRVSQNSIIYEQSYEDELIRVISHGLLHLLNFKDKEPGEIEVMRSKEFELLTKYKESFL